MRAIIYHMPLPGLRMLGAAEDCRSWRILSPREHIHARFQDRTENSIDGVASPRILSI